MVNLKRYENGFEYLEIQNSVASAKISLQGAHLFEYKTLNEEPLLWVSKASNFKVGESIRGGVPICWPWFGMHKTDTSLPQHGFARTSIFSHVDTKESKDSTELTFLLKSSKETLDMWKYKFELEYKVTIGAELKLELTTNNCDKEAFNITQALHTYFNTSDTSNVHVKGLENKPYFDALTCENKTQNGIIKIDREVDRVYQHVNTPITIVDKNRSITITNEGSDSVVVWNPWIDKCSRMSAMNSDSYKTMLCIESANAFDDEREIPPSKTHTLKAVITHTKP